MRSALLLLSLGVAAFGADIVCETNNTATATYNWNDPTGWNCYTQAKAGGARANDYPGKNYPTDNYIVVMGQSTTNNGFTTEHAMNVNTTLGVAGKGYTKWTVSGAADNGSGLIRLTTAANTIATGDKVYVWGLNGTNGDKGYGIWTATAVDTTHVDLQGSSYSGMSGQTTGTIEFPAALKRTGYSTSATTVAKWKINPGIEVVMRGDVAELWTYATRLDETFSLVRCGDSTNGGCTWTWDGTSTNPANYTVRAPAAAVRNMRFFFRGTSGAHAVVRTSPTNKPGNFADVSGVIHGDLFGDYVDFSYLGTSTTAATNMWTEATSMFSLTHFTVTTCGQFSFGNFLIDTTAGGTWLVSHGRFLTDALSTSYGSFYGAKALAGQALTFGPGISFMGMPYGSTMNAGAVVFDRCIFNNLPKPAANTANGRLGSVVKDSLIAQQGSTVTASDTVYVETLQNNYFWVDHDASGIPRHIGVGAANTDYYWSKIDILGNIFDQNSNYTDASGQAVIETTYGMASPMVVTMRGNFFLPASNYNGDAATAWSSSNDAFTQCAANMTWNIDHNTVFGPTGNGRHFLLGQGCATTEVVGKIASYKCNAVVKPAGAVLAGVLQQASNTGVPTDVATPAQVRNNALFNFSDTTDAAWGAATGTKYGFKASVAPGTGDLSSFTRMPAVVNFNRRLRDWVNQKYSQSFTLDTDAIAYLRADTTRLLDIPELVTWVKAAWTLSEPTLRGACNDGSDIGAAVSAATSTTAVRHQVRQY